MGEIEGICKAVGIVMTICCVAAGAMAVGIVAGLVYLIRFMM